MLPSRSHRAETTRSISCMDVDLPRLNLTAPRHRSTDIPIAVSTGLRCCLPAWQAEPVDAAKNGNWLSTSNPVAPSKLTFKVLGSLNHDFCGLVEEFEESEVLRENPSKHLRPQLSGLGTGFSGHKILPGRYLEYFAAVYSLAHLRQ